MLPKPTFPAEAAVGTPKQNETLAVAEAAKEAEGQPKPKKNRSFAKSAAVGVGSAAVMAAVLYANRSRRPDKS